MTESPESLWKSGEVVSGQNGGLVAKREEEMVAPTRSDEEEIRTWCETDVTHRHCARSFRVDFENCASVQIQKGGADE